MPAIKESVWGVVLDKEGRVLITKRSKRSNNPNLLNFPGGGIERGESPLDGIIRELNEEVGINSKSIALLDYYYFYEGNRKIHVYIFETRRDVKVHINNESSQFKWINLEKAAKKTANRSKWHLPTFCILRNFIAG